MCVEPCALINMIFGNVPGVRLLGHVGLLEQIWYVKVQEGNDQEKAQSERNSHSKYS